MRARGRVADLPRRPLGPHRLGARAPGQARARPARVRRSQQACGCTSTRRRATCASRRRASSWSTAQGRVRARRALLATSAFPPLLRSLRRYIAPVYDYALVSEPLDAAQRAAIGWQRRQGIGDWANQFHYYRLTADDRILFGGFDAVYRFGGPVSPRSTITIRRSRRSRSTSSPRSRSSRALRFSHRFGGAIDTCSRFCVFFGTSHRRPRLVRGRLHGPRRRRDALRRARRARSRRRPRAPTRRGCASCRAQAAAVPARAAPLARHPPDRQPPRRRRSQRRPPRSLAADARPRSGSASTAEERATRRRARAHRAAPSVAGAGLPMW